MSGLVLLAVLAWVTISALIRSHRRKATAQPRPPGETPSQQ
jgi:hypothetical protein